MKKVLRVLNTRLMGWAMLIIMIVCLAHLVFKPLGQSLRSTFERTNQVLTQEKEK